MTRMNDKKFAIIALSVLYASLAFLVLLNLVVDPYGIFQTPFFKQQSQINERYAKIEYLRKNHRRYNSYMMGSSRMIHTNPDVVGKYLPGARFYNLGTTLAAPYEHLLHLKYFIKNGYPVKNLYIGLDVDFCFTVKMYQEKELLLKLHPGVLNRGFLGYYWSYLSVFPKTDIRRKLKLNFRKKVPNIQISGKDGFLTSGEEEEDAKVFFDDPGNRDAMIIKNQMNEENLDGLRELAALCRRHEINLILFITPHNKFFMDRFAVEDYLTFLRKLSEITSFWNFSGYNSVTTNNAYYMDRSHYKSSVSRMIAARIFGDRTFAVPEDFGVRVTKESMGAHLDRLRMNIETNREESRSLHPGA